MGKLKRKPGRPSGTEPRYKAVADAIRERISNKEWVVGDRLPAVRTLAKELKSSPDTLWQALKVLKKEGRIKTDLRRRLIVTQPDTGALVTENVLLYVLGTRLDEVMRVGYPAAIIRGILKGAGEINTPVLFGHGHEFTKAPPADLEKLGLRGIVLGVSPKGRLLAQYGKLPVPVVVVDSPMSHQRIHSVSVDNAQGAFDATTRLIEMGHRRLAFIRYASKRLRDIHPDSRERQQGFERAIRLTGLPKDAGRIMTTFGMTKSESGDFAKLLRGPRKISAVLATDEGRAQLAAGTAHEMGLTIPRDLSIACFQPHPPSTRAFAGPRCSFEEMGRQAALLLNAPHESVQHLRIPCKWCDTDSVSPPR